MSYIKNPNKESQNISRREFNSKIETYDDNTSKCSKTSSIKVKTDLSNSDIKKNNQDSSKSKEESTNISISNSSVKKKDGKSNNKSPTPSRKIKEKNKNKKVIWNKIEIDVVEIESFKDYNLQIYYSALPEQRKKEDNGCNCIIF